MIAVVQVLVVLMAGAVSRRLVGWGGAPRWTGQILAAVASAAALYPVSGWPGAAFVAVAVPWAGYGWPLHGEAHKRPVMMGILNGAFTTILAAVLFYGFGLDAWFYAPAGLLAGFGYWAAAKWAPAGREGAFYDGWVSVGEMILGAALVGGLTLVGANG